MFNAPIASFTVVSIEKLIQNTIASNPITQALMGLGDEDDMFSEPAEINIADAMSDVTIRARDVAFVGAIPQPIPDDVTQMFTDASIDLSTAFAIGMNPQTTGLSSPLLVVNGSKADFLIWWNEFSN